MRLAAFITQHSESVLREWDVCRRVCAAPASTMEAAGLRDRASAMLGAIVADLEAAPPADSQRPESPGTAPGKDEPQAQAMERLNPGDTIVQVVCEYRALRESVLKLWVRESGSGLVIEPQDVMRFNQIIDQALAESVSRYSRMAAETAQHERRRLDAILDAAPVGLCVVDRDGGMLLANAENRQIWGDYPQPAGVDSYGEWKGWWADGSDRQGRRIAAHEWTTARALAGEETPRDTVQIEPFGSPGMRRTVLLRARPIRDLHDRVVGAVLAQTDITALVKAEADMRESEAKFRTIANAMPQMVWSTRPDGFHDYYNQQWYDFTGMPEHATDGEGWRGMFHAEDQPGASQAWQRSLATGEPYEVQYRLRHRSGQYRWTLGRALPVRDDAGRIIRWMGTCTDIHDQKMAEAELKRQSERKDEFLAMLAHELRNPLAPIASAADLLRIETDDPQRVRSASAVISRQVRHMTDLVDDLLDVSRVTRGLVQLDNETLDLKQVVSHAIEQVRPLIESRNHELQLRLASGPAFVQGDRTRLVQVVANILNNAAKYTPQGGLISVRLEVEHDTLRLQVSDTGSGIAPSLLPHVFDLFSQGERSPDRTQGGLGLGLSLVRHITSLHGGQITAWSEGPGKGSTFTLVLPCIARPPDPAAPPPAPREPRSAGVLSIMVVDDNIDAAWALGALLEADGHRVSIKEAAQDALDSANDETVQVFILDIGLPVMDGFELARRLRADPATAQAVLVALTGYGQAHDRVLSRAAGFDHHLVKPVDPAQLQDVLAEVAGKRAEHGSTVDG